MILLMPMIEIKKLASNLGISICTARSYSKLGNYFLNSSFHVILIVLTTVNTKGTTAPIHVKKFDNIKRQHLASFNKIRILFPFFVVDDNIPLQNFLTPSQLILVHFSFSQAVDLVDALVLRGWHNAPNGKQIIIIRPKITNVYSQPYSSSSKCMMGAKAKVPTPPPQEATPLANDNLSLK